ncbi:cytochrome P450 4g1-like [Bacillus rossius redtenbacheri]|uniref:cytochrome P450 4g1-like n=1 Tax=Bacillus rossius redtenbacheri TaxID=93214 RepID=UPI002FDD1E16
MAALEAWASWGFLTVAAAAVVIAVTWYLKISHCCRLVARIPGPPGLPLLGNTLQLIARREDILNYFKELRDRYVTVCKLWVGPILCVGMFDPQDITVILSNSKTLSKPMIYNPVTTVFGNSLLTAKFKEWKKFRKIMEPTFSNHIIDSYVSTFHEKSQRMADLLEERCHGEPFNMADYSMPCALEMLSETSLGVPMNIQGKSHQHSVVENFPKIAEVGTFTLLTPWLWFHLTHKFFPFYYKVIALVKPIRNYVTCLIKDKTESYISSRKHYVAPEASDIDINVVILRYLPIKYQVHLTGRSFHNITEFREQVLAFDRLERLSRNNNSEVEKDLKPTHQKENLSFITYTFVYNVSDIPKKRLGFLEHMVSIKVENPGLLSIEELQDQVMIIIAGGTDTTAYAVATTLMLLGLHQDVQRKVLQEQASIFGEDTSRPATTRDLQQMVYLEQVINETMRLYPVVPFVARRVDEDVSVNSYTLPAGTIVLIPIYLVHRNPEYFPNPGTFDPDRFSRENSACHPACSFIPFSYGRKMCLGKSYAYMAMKTMLSVLLRRYEVLEYGSRDDMESFKFEMFLKFKHGHSIRLRQRNCVFKKM